MRVETKYPEVISFEYRQEKGDPDLGTCLYMNCYLVPDRGALMIMSDCGNYSYTWPEKEERFLNLMASMGKDKEYLLRKLVGKPKDVDVEATLEGLRERYDESDVDDAIDDLTARFDDHYPSNTDLATCLIEEWADEYDLDTADLWECVRTRYTAQEERVVNIFCDNIVPQIGRYLENRPGIQRTATLSIYHVSSETDALISEGELIELSVYPKDEFGWWIELTDDQDYNKAHIPEDIKACIAYARSLGCTWLCLDCEGPEVKTLKKYEW